MSAQNSRPIGSNTRCQGHADSVDKGLHLPPSQEANFHDLIAPFYTRIYGPSWSKVVESQGRKLEEIISARRPVIASTPCDVLDSACGIGTQILHLGKNSGYRVVGVDLSAGAIEQARKHAEAAHATVELREGDMLELSRLLPGRMFDVVLSCDNVLRHLPNRAAIEVALAEQYACLRPGGILIATLRDFAPEQQQSVASGSGYSIKPYSAHNNNGTLEAYFQVGRFEADFYHLEFFAVSKKGEEAQVKSASLKLLAIEIDQVKTLMLKSGFGAVEVTPNVPEFYGHVLLIAHKGER